MVTIDNNDELECPGCKATYLHRKSVCTVGQKVLVTFWCDACHAKPIIIFKPRKGRMVIEWLS